MLTVKFFTGDAELSMHRQYLQVTVASRGYEIQKHLWIRYGVSENTLCINMFNGFPWPIPPVLYHFTQANI
jgi:hypothetical protein